MGCAGRAASWRRRLWEVVGHPSSLALVLVGGSLLVLGVVLDQATLVTVGPATLVLAAVLPLANEVEVGPGGLKFTRKASEREATFATFVSVEKASLHRLAVLLCGDGPRTVTLVEDALAETYVEWDGDVAGLRRHVRCELVRLVLGASRLGLTGRPGGDGGGARFPPEAAPLAGLAPRDRAVLLLRHYEDLACEEIAEILGCARDEVLADLDRAEAVLQPTLAGGR
jgi:hypothetical protein